MMIDLILMIQRVEYAESNMKKIEFWRWEGRGKIHTMTKMMQLQRCEDASKNDWGGWWMIWDG